VLYSLAVLWPSLFPVAAAKMWNALPDDVVSASFVNFFRHQLKKKHLFSGDLSVVSTLVDRAIVSNT